MAQPPQKSARQEERLEGELTRSKDVIAEIIARIEKSMKTSRDVPRRFV